MNERFSLHGTIDEWQDYLLADWLRSYDRAGVILHVDINSPGGNVFQAFQIFNRLTNAQATIHTHISALAASAGSIVALAGERVTMNDYALIMWHNCWGNAKGDADELRKQAGVMEKVRNSMATIYQRRTGRDFEAVIKDMKDESWYDASEALSLGLIDQVAETPNRGVKGSLKGQPLGEIYASLSAMAKMPDKGDKPAADPAANPPITNTKQVQQPNIIPDMSLATIAAALGCTEAEVDTKVEAMKKELSTTKAKVEAAQLASDNYKAQAEANTAELETLRREKKAQEDASAVAAVEAAIKDRKIPLADKDKWVEKVKATPELSEMLASLPSNPLLSKITEPAGGGKEDEDDMTPWERRQAEIEANANKK